MKLVDYIIALAIGLIVGMAAYLLTSQFLFDSDKFKADIEQVNSIDSEFNTESTDIFTDNDRTDYSSPVRLNDKRNTKPFTNDQ